MLEEARNLDMPSEEGVEQMFDSHCGLESTWGFVVGNFGLYEISETKRDDTRPSQLVIRNKCRSDAFENPTIRLSWSEIESNLGLIIPLVIFV